MKLNKTKKVLLITIPLLIIGGVVLAMKKKPTTTPIPTPTPPTPPAPAPKRKPAEIIIGPTTGGITLEYDTLYTIENATMWSYPSTIGSDEIKSYAEGVALKTLQTGTFNGENWWEVKDEDGDTGWIKESQLFI